MTPVELPLPIPGQSGDVLWRREPNHVSREVDPAPDLLVVGAGIAGLAVAAEARRRGIERILVIDALGIATRASGRNAGALIPDANALTLPAGFARLARRGLELHRRFHAKWSLPLREIDWLVPSDSLAEPPDGEALASARATVLDRASIESRLGTRSGIEEAVLVPDQALTDPVAVATELVGEIGQVTVGVEALGIEMDRDRVTGVGTTAGTIHPRWLVLATGRAPDAVAPDQRWIKGHLAVTVPAPLDLGRHAIGGSLVVIPQLDARLLVGGTREEGDVDGAVRPDVTTRIRTELARILPDAADLAFERVWTGQRPAGRDELPIIDRLAGATNAYLVAGLYHSGLCTAPAIAEAIVEALGTGQLPEIVRPFAIPDGPHRTKHAAT